MEDANAPINIKVSLKKLAVQRSPGTLLFVARATTGQTVGLGGVIFGGGVRNDYGGLTRRVQVTTQTGEEVFFKIKRSTKLSKLQAAYASKVGKEVSSIR